MYKHRKKVRSSQTAILAVINWVKKIINSKKQKAKPPNSGLPNRRIKCLSFLTINFYRINLAVKKAAMGNILCLVCHIVLDIYLRKSYVNSSSKQFSLALFVSAPLIKNIKLFFFFLSGFLRFFSQPFTNHRIAGKGRGHFVNSSLPLPSASRTLGD